VANLRKRKDRGTWELEYRDIGDTEKDPDGKRYRINFKSDEKSAKEALRKVESKILLVELGTLDKVGHILEGNEGKKQQETKGTREKCKRISEFKVWHEQRARNELDHKQDTISTYNNAFNSIEEFFENKYVHTLTEEDVREWKENATKVESVKDANGKRVRRRTKNKLSKTALSMYGRSLKAAWTRAIKDGFADENPFKIRWPGPSETRRKNASMTVEEVEKILQVTLDSGYVRLHTYFQLGAHTGLRRGETLRIQGKHIDMAQKILTIYITKKRGEPQQLKVPINKHLFEILKDVRIEPEEFLFQTHAWSHKDVPRPWTKWYVTHKFKELAKKAGLPQRYTLHSFRKTFVTYLHQKGIPTNVIQRLIGHSSPSITFMEYDNTDALAYRQFADEVDFGSKPEDET
jgi:integrase